MESCFPKGPESGWPVECSLKLNVRSYFHFVSYDIDNHRHPAHGYASSAVAGGKQVTSEAEAHVSPTGTGRCWHRWQAVSSFTVCLMHEKIADNQLKQCLCHSGDID